MQPRQSSVYVAECFFFTVTVMPSGRSAGEPTRGQSWAKLDCEPHRSPCPPRLSASHFPLCTSSHLWGWQDWKRAMIAVSRCPVVAGGTTDSPARILPGRAALTALMHAALLPPTHLARCIPDPDPAVESDPLPRCHVCLDSFACTAARCSCCYCC